MTQVMCDNLLLCRRIIAAFLPIDHRQKDFLMSNYEEIAYESHAFQKTHPLYLAAIAKLFGMDPVPPEQARILEVGCASGGNLIPMATQLPEARFLGIDLAENQIRDGQDLLARSGMSNVELRCADIRDIDASWGEFDYIIAHGVYSWVPADIASRLLEVFRNQLSPQGIAHVSYNVYPGWHLREAVRDMMLYHVTGFESPRDKITQARALLDFVAEHSPRQDLPETQLIAREAALLRQYPDYYLYHEHLEPENRPCYFHEFTERIHSAGLKYLGDAVWGTMFDEPFGADTQELLRRVGGGNLIRMEQYMDFLRFRTFRDSLLVRPEIALQRKLDGLRFHDLAVGSRMQSTGKIDLTPGVEVVFKAPQGVELTMKAPLNKAVFKILQDIAPQVMPVDRLIREASAMAGLADPTAEQYQHFLRAIGADFFRLAAAGAVDIAAGVWPMTTRVSTKPAVTKIARMAAEAQAQRVVNQRHEEVKFDDSLWRLIPLVDGTRTVEELAIALAERSQREGWAMKTTDAEAQITDFEGIRKQLLQMLPRDLERLCKLGMLAS